MIKAYTNVELLKYPSGRSVQKNSADRWGRTTMNEDSGLVHVSCMNQPYAGSFCGWVPVSHVKVLNREM